MITLDAVLEIESFLKDMEEPKGAEMRVMHKLVRGAFPESLLWLDDGIDEKGKVVTNPTIGYGLQVIRYANGKRKDFFRIGISANSTGISVYVLGLEDKSHLQNAYGSKIGKAKVTGYCIKFKSIKDIDLEVLMEAIGFGMGI